MQTRQPRSYIAHEDGHIRSVPRDQQAAQLRPSRRRERDFLKSAENVDIDNAGRLRSRPGVTLIQAMTGAHSLFLTSDTSGVSGATSSLYAIHPADLYGNAGEGTVREHGDELCHACRRGVLLECNAGTAAGGINLL